MTWLSYATAIYGMRIFSLYFTVMLVSVYVILSKHEWITQSVKIKHFLFSVLFDCKIACRILFENEF